MTWRPIATAPRDGSDVLLWAGRDCHVGYWSIVGWADVWAGECPWIDPSHWMPLPQPPMENE